MRQRTEFRSIDLCLDKLGEKIRLDTILLDKLRACRRETGWVALCDTVLGKFCDWEGGVYEFEFRGE